MTRREWLRSAGTVAALGLACRRAPGVLAAVRDRVQKLKSAGRSLAEAQAAKPTADYDAASGKGTIAPDDFVALVYNTL